MNFSPTFFRVELVRQARNPFTLIFTLAMPVVMYVIFGATPEYSDVMAGRGNVAFTVMTSMAAFGTATAMTSLTSLAASEFARGWGRQLALTPLTVAGYALTKVLVALAYSTLSVVVVFLVGAATGARPTEGWVWLAAGAIILAGCCMFGLFGLGMGMLFSSEGASGLASIMITFFSFFGNVFMPLSGVMLDIAKFTPMYGYNALARWPQLEGGIDAVHSDPLWAILLNVAAWTVVFAGLVVIGTRRVRARQ